MISFVAFSQMLTKECSFVGFFFLVFMNEITNFLSKLIKITPKNEIP